MRLNDMLDYTRLLTGTVGLLCSLVQDRFADQVTSIGFIPDAAALHAVAQVAEELRNKEPNKLAFIHVLDREWVDCLTLSAAAS